MRLWSIHPKYLDSQGLVALWRETLLAQKVLAGRTKGYKHHPQLIRFRETPDPLASIGLYLHHIFLEASARGYSFDGSKILKKTAKLRAMTVARGQVAYEFEHLLRKLKLRDPERLKKMILVKAVRVHPVFRVVRGSVAEWEKAFKLH